MRRALIGRNGAARRSQSKSSALCADGRGAGNNSQCDCILFLCEKPQEEKRGKDNIDRIMRNLTPPDGKARALLATMWKGFRANGCACVVEKYEL